MPIVACGVENDGSLASVASWRSRSSSATIRCAAARTALTPADGVAECAARPWRVMSIAALPLWRSTTRSSVGSPTTTPASGAAIPPRERVEQRCDARAGELLVVRDRHVQRRVQRRRVGSRHRGQRRGDEGLHVGGPASVEPAAVGAQDEGVGRPGLARDVHDVSVRGEQHAPRRVGRAEHGVQHVRARPRSVVHADVGAGLVQDRGDVGDQLAVAAAGDRRLGDQAGQERGRVRRRHGRGQGPSRPRSPPGSAARRPRPVASREGSPAGPAP